MTEPASLHRFVFERPFVRGERARLDATGQTVPPPVWRVAGAGRSDTRH